MITFEDGVNGRIQVCTEFQNYMEQIGVIYYFEDQYYFEPARDSFFTMEMIQDISKKLEELNGGE